MTAHKMKVRQRQVREVEMEVEFPIYSENDVTVDGAPEPFIIYSKTTRDPDTGRMRKISLYVSGTTCTVMEMDYNHRFEGSNIDRHLGRGAYISSEKEFAAAAAQVKAVTEEL